MVYNYYDSNPYYIRSRREPSIFDGFTLRPLPYPVLAILLVVCVFLGMKFTSSYEEVAETTEAQINWVLLATPLILIFAVKLVSSVEGRCGYYNNGYDSRKMGYCGGAGGGRGGGGGGGGGASPWGVAAFIVLLLLLVQFQSCLFG